MVRLQMEAPVCLCVSYSVWGHHVCACVSVAWGVETPCVCLCVSYAGRGDSMIQIWGYVFISLLRLLNIKLLRLPSFSFPSTLCPCTKLSASLIPMYVSQ